MRRLVGLLLASIAWSTGVSAQDFPMKSIRLIVPYPPGGPTDLVGRTYAAKMQELWSHPVVVENRSGANGNIASQLVAKAPGDGYTLLLHASSLVINPFLYKAPGYDPVADFTPIGLVFDYKLIVVVHPSLPVKSLAELIAAAKARPGEITYASGGGVGAPTHLSVEMFKQTVGIDLLHIPYAGGAPAVNDLLAGHVKMMFNNPTQSLQYIKTGKLRALATTGAKRMAQAPELPTVAELGYPGYDVGTWYAVWGPAGVPPAVVETINGAIRKISDMKDVQEQLYAQGLAVLVSTASELADFQKSETARWGKVIRDAKIEAQ